MSYHINHYINVCFLYVLFPGGRFLFPLVAFFSCTNKNHVPSDGFHLKSPQGPQQAAPDHILKNYGSLENIFPPSQVVTPHCFGGSFRYYPNRKFRIHSPGRKMMNGRLSFFLGDFWGPGLFSGGYIGYIISLKLPVE